MLTVKPYCKKIYINEEMVSREIILAQSAGTKYVYFDEQLPKYICDQLDKLGYPHGPSGSKYRVTVL